LYGCYYKEQEQQIPLGAGSTTIERNSTQEQEKQEE
jgi:hypothetical protein